MKTVIYKKGQIKDLVVQEYEFIPSAKEQVDGLRDKLKKNRSKVDEDKYKKQVDKIIATLKTNIEVNNMNVMHYFDTMPLELREALEKIGLEVKETLLFWEISVSKY